MNTTIIAVKIVVNNVVLVKKKLGLYIQKLDGIDLGEVIL